MVNERLQNGYLTPGALVQINSAYEPGPAMAELIAKGTLHPECSRIFADKKPDGSEGSAQRATGEPGEFMLGTTDGAEKGANGQVKKK